MSQNGLKDTDTKSVVRSQRNCRHNEKLTDWRIWRFLFEVTATNYNSQPVSSRARMFSPSNLVKNVQNFKKQVDDSRKSSNNMTISNNHSYDEDTKNEKKNNKWSILPEQIKYMTQVHQNLIQNFNKLRIFFNKN